MVYQYLTIILNKKHPLCGKGMQLGSMFGVIVGWEPEEDNDQNFETVNVQVADSIDLDLIIEPLKSLVEVDGSISYYEVDTSPYPMRITFVF